MGLCLICCFCRPESNMSIVIPKSVRANTSVCHSKRYCESWTFYSFNFEDEFLH